MIGLVRGPRGEGIVDIILVPLAGQGDRPFAYIFL